MSTDYDKNKNVIFINSKSIVPVLWQYKTCEIHTEYLSTDSIYDSRFVVNSTIEWKFNNLESEIIT